MKELKRRKPIKKITEEQAIEAITLNDKYGTLIAAKMIGTDPRTLVRRYEAFGLVHKERPEVNLSVPAISISEHFLFHIRKAHYLTQQQMATIFEISQSQYGRYELAPENLPLHCYLRMIAYFGEDTVRLFLEFKTN